MHLRSSSFVHQHPLPSDFAFALPGGVLAPNRNPALSWSGAPRDTRSFALLCLDVDAPTRPEMAGAPGVTIPFEQPRTEFVHWCLVDLPPTVTDLAEGSASNGVTPHGKRSPSGPSGSRQGLNDYTQWFKNNPELQGDYFGYDGPYPPPNDLRIHRYIFRLYALDLPRLDLAERFTADDVKSLIDGHILDAADIMATYTLNPEARTASV